MARLLDKRKSDGKFPFKYRSAANTDIRLTFERVRRELQQRMEQEQIAEQERDSKLTYMRKR